MKVSGVTFPEPQRHKDGRLFTHYYQGRTRRFVTAPDLDALRAKLAKVATHLRNGTLDAAELGAADLRDAVAARAVLAESGMTLEDAARFAVDLLKIGGDQATVREAVRFHRSRRGANSATTLGEAIASLLLHKRSAQLSEDYLVKLARDLRRFEKAFGEETRIATLNAAQLDAWLQSLPGAARHRRNVRDGLILLWKFARDQQILPADLRTEAEKTARPRVLGGDVAIYKPAELAIMLSHATADELPVVAIGAFAGLRLAEIERLHWTAIDFEKGFIKLRAQDTKTGDRRPVLMQPVLRTWLSGYSDRGGRVVPWPRIGHHLRRLCQRCGVKYQPNGLRHSFGSYYTAQTRNLAEVALQMGNSPAMIRSHYLEAVGEEDAQKWFAVRPADMTNVLKLQFR